MKKEKRDFKELGLFIIYSLSTICFGVLAYGFTIWRFNKLMIMPMFGTGEITPSFAVGIAILMMSIGLFYKNTISSVEKIDTLGDITKKLTAIIYKVVSLLIISKIASFII